MPIPFTCRVSATARLSDQADLADGRRLRRVRSTDAVVEAFLELVERGASSPTAQQVAERSGVSLRTVFRLFDDSRAMHAAAITRQTRRIQELMTEVPLDLPLDDRVRLLVTERAAVFEAIAPVRRLAVRLTDDNAIAAGLDRHHRELRREIERVLAAELATLAPVQRRQTLAALDAAGSWETWDQLRRVQALGVRTAERVVVQTILALLNN